MNPDRHHDNRPNLLFRNRNFVLLWAAYAISALGDHLSEMGLLDMQDALGKERGDTTRIGAILLFAFMLPFFILAPFMGWLADRLPRKWIMITADVVRAGLMFSLYGAMLWLLQSARGSSFEIPLHHSRTHEPLYSPWFYAMPLLLMGIFAAMFSPSRAAMLPTLVRT